MKRLGFTIIGLLAALLLAWNANDDHPAEIRMAVDFHLAGDACGHGDLS